MRQRRKRRYCTAAESAEIWDRWQKGEGLKSIGRVFGKSSGSIFSLVRRVAFGRHRGAAPGWR